MGFFFFCCGIAFGQVSVVQYNSSWNAENSIDISELKDCKKESVLICHNEDLKDKYNIKSVPTIVIFDDGEEYDDEEEEPLEIADVNSKMTKAQLIEMYNELKDSVTK